ncbi:hypothetical protein AM593_10271, partial [Mytilus galloprovincialis]
MMSAIIFTQGRNYICLSNKSRQAFGYHSLRYPDNLASGGTAIQNPPNSNNPASLSIDGNRTNGICSRTTGQGSYLQIDIGSMSVVTTIYITFGGKQGRSLYCKVAFVNYPTD